MSEPLPFGIERDRLSELSLLYGYYSPKTGAGKQELTVRGDGSVHLLKTLTREAEPEEVEGYLPSGALDRLLELLHDLGLHTLDERYVGGPHSHGQVRRIVRLSLGEDQLLQVIFQGGDCAEFERISGAIKMAAGLATPAALRRRFFRNL